MRQIEGSLEVMPLKEGFRVVVRDREFIGLAEKAPPEGAVEKGGSAE